MSPGQGSEEPTSPPEAVVLNRLIGEWDAEVVSRNRDGLRKAIQAIAELEADNTSVRFSNALTTAKLMAVAALLREESRGGHRREDFPDARTELQKRTFLTLEKANRIIAEITETVKA